MLAQDLVRAGRMGIQHDARQEWAAVLGLTPITERRSQKRAGRQGERAFEVDPSHLGRVHRGKRGAEHPHEVINVSAAP
jgi:hypothetical protein